MAILEEISTLLQAGRAPKVKAAVQQALDEGVAPKDILEHGLLAGMGVIGEKFRNGEVFVPEVLVAARAMNKGVEVLKPHMSSGDVEDRGTAIIGTVRGDLHDIGKNLVASMFEGCGFEVINLGVDVSSDKFISAALENKADIICMSALLTTTMNYMKEVVAAVEASELKGKVKIMVGGAPVNDAFAKAIGADAYTSNANAAVVMAKKLIAAN